VADPGISEQGSAVEGKGSALKPPVDPGQSPGGGPGAKPPEADEFSHIKGVFFFYFR
jgi:hypothetical protein